MTIHAFIDESRRGNQYLMAMVRVDPTQLTPVRLAMRKLLLPGERELHFNNEKNPRRRGLADHVARLPVEAALYTHACGRSDEPARQSCLAMMTADLVAQGAQLMVLDSRNNWQGNDRDRHDRSTLQRILGKPRHSSKLVFQHVDSADECLLWIADIAAWCWGAGGDWRRRIQPIVKETIPVDP